MVTRRQLGWPSLLVFSFLVAVIHFAVWILYFFHGWTYGASVSVLLGFERIGLPTVTPSIEGFPLPSLLGWFVLFVLFWLFYAVLVVAAARLRLGSSDETI